MDVDLCRGLPCYYTGGDFSCFEFEEDSKWRSIRPYSERYVHFKTDDDIIFQFRFDYFHYSKHILITSTAQDVFWIFLPWCSLTKTLDILRRADARPSVKGFHKKGDGKKTSRRWGGYLLKFYDRLQEHIGAIDLSDDALKIIYQSLLYREELYEI